LLARGALQEARHHLGVEAGEAVGGAAGELGVVAAGQLDLERQEDLRRDRQQAARRQGQKLAVAARPDLLQQGGLAVRHGQGASFLSWACKARSVSRLIRYSRSTSPLALP